MARRAELEVERALLELERVVLQARSITGTESETMLQIAYMVAGRHGPPPDDYDLDPGKAIITRILGSLAVPTEQGAIVSGAMLADALNLFWGDGAPGM